MPYCEPLTWLVRQSTWAIVLERPETNDNASFTSEVRVGYVRHVSPDCPGDWWSREINISEYQLYRWLRDHGADEGETVLVCWAGGAS